MPRPIEHRGTFRYPAEQVYAALTDEEYLRERLAEIGGKDAELLSHDADADTVRAVMRQGIGAEDLPGLVQRFVPQGVVIERTETWTSATDGGYQGTVEASVRGMPASVAGTMTLTNAADGSEMVTTGEVKVEMRLVGGKIESVIAEQIGQLLSEEAEFTNRWLESRNRTA